MDSRWKIFSRSGLKSLYYFMLFHGWLFGFPLWWHFKPDAFQLQVYMHLVSSNCFYPWNHYVCICVCVSVCVSVCVCMCLCVCKVCTCLSYPEATNQKYYTHVKEPEIENYASSTAFQFPYMAFPIVMKEGCGLSNIAHVITCQRRQKRLRCISHSFH